MTDGVRIGTMSSLCQRCQWTDTLMPLHLLHLLQMKVTILMNLGITAVSVSALLMKKLIVGNELTERVVNSLKYFSVMTRKGVSETAHDEYIQHTNALLRKENPPDADAIERRGEDLDGLGDCLCICKLIVDGDDTVGLLNAYSCASRLQKLTGICHLRIDCCKNSCIAFTGVYVKLQTCPFCSEPRCNNKNIPIQTFDLIPIIHRLRLQFANSGRAQALREYPQSLKDNPFNGV
jgi:hypothetical protein